MHEFLSITKALSDESRVRALLSVKDGELCLCQIIEVLRLAPATVSRHMNILYDAGLVLRRKEGKWHFYRLAQVEGDPMAQRTLEWVLREMEKDPAARDDLGRIRKVRRLELEEVSECYRS